VSGDQLLLLVQGVEEAEGVHPKADDGHDRKRQERGNRCQRHSRSLARSRRSAHDERDRKTGRGLHSHPGDERRHRRPRSRRGAGGKQQRSRQREQHECVVVRPRYRQQEQNRIESHERRRRLGRVTHTPRRSGRQRHGAQAR